MVSHRKSTVNSVQETVGASNSGGWEPVTNVFSGRLILFWIFAVVQVFVCAGYFRAGIRQILNKWASTHDRESKALTEVAPWEHSVHGFPMPSLERLRTRFFQDNWEIAAQKNFLIPEHVSAVACRDIKAAFAKLSLSPFRTCRTGIPLLNGYKFFEEEQRICGPPRIYREADRQKLPGRAQFYNHLCATHPQIRFYIFPTLRVEDWCAIAGVYGDAHAYFAGDDYVREFRTLLDSSIGYGWAAEGLTSAEAISWYYRTDHHWCFDGAYNAYCQIWQMFRSQNPQTGKLLEPLEWMKLPGLCFYGSYARRAGYFDQIHDVIINARFDMPEMEVRVHGAEHQGRNKREQYKAGNYDAAQFANHYASFFGSDYGLIEYTCKTGSASLLVLSDSYDNCIEPLLASHFQHSYFVDLRHYSQDVGDEFMIDEFIEQNAISDVLFVGNQSWVLGLVPFGGR